MTGAIVAGIGATEFSKDSGRSTMQLAAEASRAAILDAGLTPADIDGVVTFTVDGNDELQLMRNLGVERDHLVVAHARRRRGRLRHRAARGRGGDLGTGQRGARVPRVQRAVAVPLRPTPRPAPGPAPLDWYYTFGIDTPAKMYALWFRRYMHAYGATNEDFGRYTVSARRYAATNPKAWFHDRPITLEDHQASRWIVEPVLRLYDCCQESDGGVALVVTRAERTGDVDQPVAIVAVADAHQRDASITVELLPRRPGDVSGGRGMRRALLFARAGLSPADVDVAEIYENFSPLVFLRARGVRLLRSG